ncbi:MAG: class I SAM-dependent methyltransferase [Candidatus Babeliales bacterium]|jgi:SAM-dependent methyltransferase
MKLLLKQLILISFFSAIQASDMEIFTAGSPFPPGTTINKSSILDVVDHKNMQLKLYLDAIQYNVQEKIGILPYVLQKESGIYLEIGTGGDPIAALMKAIPSHYNVQIIASDVDQNVLDSVLTRHPELQQFVQSQNGPRLHLQQLNAIDMSAIVSNHLDGINASSVLHEIISYAGGLDGCKKFFKEAHRVLKQDGILIYRDPEFVSNQQQAVTVRLKNKPSKLFSHIFLYKFLDARGSSLAQKNRKVFMYETKDISFKIYKKNETNCAVYSYEEYLKIPSYDIDFSRKYSISLPYGLYRELSRHYLTYLHACNPLVYLKATANISTGTYFTNYLAHSTVKVLKNFLGEHSHVLNDAQITLEQKDLIDSAIEKNCEVLEFGIPLRFTSKSKKAALRNILKQHDFDPSRYIIAVDSETSLLDYRIFGILYEQIKNLFDTLNSIEIADNEKHAYWLKREGEEYYCYYSVDALLSQVLLYSLEQSKLDQSGLQQSENTVENNEIMVLCPLDKEYNKFLNRWCYSELLKDTLEVSDNMNYPMEVFDEKRIIHFKKMKLSQAIHICESIIEAEPMNYPQLTQVVSDLKDPASHKGYPGFAQGYAGQAAETRKL